jgi:hypothetical protein
MGKGTCAYRGPRITEDAVMQGLIISSTHLHRDESHNDVVEHTHPGGCHLQVRLLLLEQAGPVELSDQSLVWVVDNQLRFALRKMSALM